MIVLYKNSRLITGKRYGIGLTKAGVGTDLTSIMAIRNRLMLDDLPNRAVILLTSTTLSTDTTKTGVFEVIRNPVVASGDYLDFVETGKELADIAINDAEIIGGDVIGIFNVKAGQVITSTVEAVNPVEPGDIICFAARVTSGTASEFDTSLSWQEDL